MWIGFDDSNVAPCQQEQPGGAGRQGGQQKADREEEEGGLQDLLGKFSRLKLCGQAVISRETPGTATHIGELPQEVVQYILKWVVSAELDWVSLERCAQVCRALYLAARDSELWRLGCARLWGVAALQSGPLTDYRQLLIDRPRVLFGGCYVSKITYLREGERGYQDHETFRAWHVVEYNRFLRFFPGGQAVMVTSSDDAALVAKQLNTRACINLPAVMVGDYKIVENLLVCVLHKNKDVKKKINNRFGKRKGKREMMDYYEVPEQDFHMEFYISGAKFHNLEWKDYNMVSKYKSGAEKVDQFDLRDQRKFPMMKFRVVGSYHFESNSPLK